MHKLGVVIVDGVGYRNFVLSDFLKEIQRQNRPVTVFSFLPPEVYDASLKLDLIEIPISPESRATWFFRKLKEVAHLMRHRSDNPGMARNLGKNWNSNHNVRGWLTRMIFAIARRLNSERWICRFGLWQEGITRANSKDYRKCKAVLENAQVDSLFFTHQRPSFVSPLAYAAKDLGIPTTAFIFSWDNLASKGRMAADFDHYLVWSSLMKQELQHFYPGIDDLHVTVVGTPQFEPYVLDHYAITDKEFRQRFSINDDLPIICYSCGDVSTSMNDPLYIELIATALEGGGLPEAHLLVRTSPAEDASRFDNIRAVYPQIIWNFPNWPLTRNTHAEIWSQRVPTTSDMVDLRSILEHSAVGVNMLSTMSLDFMLFDKPVVNPVMGNSDNGLYQDQEYLGYKHIQCLVSSGSTYVVKDEASLIAAIRSCLEGNGPSLVNMANFKEQQIGEPLVGTSRRLVDALYK